MEIKHDFGKEKTLFVKGFAITYMVFYHAFKDLNRWSNPLPYGYVVANYFCDFGQVCISMFNILSGIGLYYSLSSNNNKRIFSFY